MKRFIIALSVGFMSVAMTACSPGNLFGSTLPPTPTSTLTPLPPPTPTITFTPTIIPRPTPFGDYLGEGKIRTVGENSGVEVIYAYILSITFRVLPDGTIEGEGTRTEVEESTGSTAYQCKIVDVSSLTFPPLQVSGTLRLDATFQLSVMGPPSTVPTQLVCVSPLAGS